MKLSFTACLFLLATTLQAQSTAKISGQIVDGNTGSPLSDVNIIVVETGQGAASDREGRFEINNLLAGVYTLKISRIGYADRLMSDMHLSRDASLLLSVRLQREPLILTEVTVTAPRSQAGEGESVIHLGKDRIEKSGARTLQELISALPGVEVCDQGSSGGKSSVSIRGSRADQVLIIIDGRPQPDGISGGDLSLIPLNMVESVTLHKGGASPRFGGGAIGGVIEITTRKPRRKELSGRMEYGSFCYRSLGISMEGLEKKTGYLISLSHRASREDYPFSYQAPGDTLLNERRRNADYRITDMFSRIRWQSGAQTLSLDAGLHLSDRGLPGKVFSWTPYANTTATHWRGGADYSYRQDRLKARASLDFSGDRVENTNIYPDSAALRDSRYPPYHYLNHLSTIHWRTGLSLYVLAPGLLTLEYEGRCLRFHDEDLYHDVPSGIGKASHLLQSLTLWQGLKWNLPRLPGIVSFSPELRCDLLAIRREESLHREFHLSPGLEMRLSLSRPMTLYLRGSLSHNFRPPTFADLFYQDFRIQGSPELLPEKSLHLESALGTVLPLAGMVRLEGAVFRDRVDDYISWRLGSFEVFRPYNTDADIRGEEITLEWASPGEGLRLEGGYTRLDPRDMSENRATHGKYLPYRPLQSCKASLFLRHSWLDITLTLERSGRRYTNEANTSYADPYTKVDLFFTEELNINGVRLSATFSILNCLDSRYQIIEGMVLPGRRFGLSLKAVMPGKGVTL